MPASTLQLAGGRPTAIAPSAMPLQWTTAFSAAAAGVPVGPRARTTASMSVAARPILVFRRLASGSLSINVFGDFIVFLSLVFCWLRRKDGLPAEFQFRPAVLPL
jgi:hypothetical protein